MPNIMDYISWRGDLSFKAAPFCEVDNLVLSMLSFINFSDIVSSDPLGNPVRLSECLKKYNELYPSGENFGRIIPQKIGELFRLAAQSKRFSDLYATYYKSETSREKTVQFAAVTFILPDNSLFVAFRGTDDSIVGWREDFNLSFTYPVPAQEMAAEYLKEASSVYSGNIRIGGHSKGGNLAVYSAVFSPKVIRDRIIAVYSNDGPGFVREVIESDPFRELEGRISTIVPQSSVIGMIFEHKEKYQVIESTISDSQGLLQHNPFSWSVIGPSFVHLESLSKQGKWHDEVMSEWLSQISTEERKKFTDTLFGILESTGASTLTDLSVDQFAKLGSAIHAFGELDKETKETMFRMIKKLAAAGVNARGNV